MMFPKPIKKTPEEKRKEAWNKYKERTKKRMGVRFNTHKAPKKVKKRLQSLKNLKRVVWQKFTHYIHLRDSQHHNMVKCISCETIKNVYDLESGHFYPRSTSSFLYFNEDNVHLQCTRCNRFLHANIHEYRPNLIKKIGEDRVRYLDEHRHDRMKWNREALEKVKEETQKKIDELKNEKNQSKIED